MLYIMRHGKTEWNKKKKLQGRTDIPLCREGIEMAEKAREEYKDVHLDICYCSPLIRARKTAELVIGGRNIPIIPDDRLKEMSFGEYEGIENSFDIPDCPINLLFFHPEQYTSSIGGAETFDELFGRTGEFLDKVVYPQVEQGKDIPTRTRCSAWRSPRTGMPAESSHWRTRCNECKHCVPDKEFAAV